MKRKYKMSTKFFLAIYLGISLSNGAVADSSVAIPSPANSKNSGIIYKSTGFYIERVNIKIGSFRLL